MSGDIFGYHTLEGGATGIWRVEARDAAKHSTIHRTALTTKDYLAPSVTSAGLRKLGLNDNRFSV